MSTDAHQALENLSSLDQKRLLVRVSKKFDYVQQRGGPAPEDLFQDAVVSLLEGRRQCPGHIELLKCLWQIIRSLANHDYHSSRRTEELDCAGIDDDRAPQAPDDSDPANRITQDDIDRFRASLADDPRLQILLDGKLRGISQREIAAQLQLSDAGVTKLKRVLQQRYKAFFGDQ